jgi:hypothetical protein
LPESISPKNNHSRGYKEHCQHQEKIVERLEDWMQCVLKRYYPYGSPEMAGSLLVVANEEAESEIDSAA